MLRKFALFLLLILGASTLFAEEVDLAAARQFAHGWRARPVKGGRTVRNEHGESRFHVVNFEGGGWAAVGADDEDAPVIAFSDNGDDLIEDERNPIWFLVKRDAERYAANRQESKRQGRGRGKHKGWSHKRKPEQDGGGRLKLATGESKIASLGIEKVCVAPMLQSTWDQGTADGSKTGPNCYNYYTPNQYACGCVATMMAQIMRYHEWPRGEVEPKTKICYVGSTLAIAQTKSVEKKMMGGLYDWSKMDLSPTASTPLANRQAIGKLCYDCGVSVHMIWSAEGSGAYMEDVAGAFTNDFKYVRAKYLGEYDYNTGYKDLYKNYTEKFKSIVISNCDAGLPIAYGISSASSGHAVVIDGYGYTGNGFFIHINPGWSGKANAWYCPPNLSMGSGDYNFTNSDELIYDITPPRPAKVLFR